MALRDVLAHTLPVVNAALNATCAVLLFSGRQRIARGERLLHGRFMFSAFLVSGVFLVSYLTRVALTGTTRFHGPFALKAFYLAVLFSHMILAMAVVPMVFRSIYLARAQRFDEHKRIARWTYPVWMYVSVTGVLVYVLLYHVSERPSSHALAAQSPTHSASELNATTH